MWPSSHSGGLISARSGTVSAAPPSAGLAGRDPAQRMIARVDQRQRQQILAGTAHARRIHARGLDVEHVRDSPPETFGPDRQPGPGRRQQRQLAHRARAGRACCAAIVASPSSSAWSGEPCDAADRAARAALGAEHRRLRRGAPERPLRRRADRHRSLPRHPRRRRGAALARAGHAPRRAAGPGPRSSCAPALRAKAAGDLPVGAAPRRRVRRRGAACTRRQRRPPARREGSAHASCARPSGWRPRADIRFEQIGGALDPALAAAARPHRGSRTPRYRWLGGLPRAGDAAAHPARPRCSSTRAAWKAAPRSSSRRRRAATAVLASRIPGNVGMLGRDPAGCFDLGDDAGARPADRARAATTVLSWRGCAPRRSPARRSSSRAEEERRLVELIHGALAPTAIKAPTP